MFNLWHVYLFAGPKNVMEPKYDPGMSPLCRCFTLSRFNGKTDQRGQTAVYSQKTRTKMRHLEHSWSVFCESSSDCRGVKAGLKGEEGGMKDSEKVCQNNKHEAGFSTWRQFVWRHGSLQLFLFSILPNKLPFEVFKTDFYCCIVVPTFSPLCPLLPLCLLSLLSVLLSFLVLNCLFEHVQHVNMW